MSQELGPIFRCAQCTAEVRVIEAVTRVDDLLIVTCPGCGTRYKQRAENATESLRSLLSVAPIESDDPSSITARSAASGAIARAALSAAATRSDTSLVAPPVRTPTDSVQEGDTRTIALAPRGTVSAKAARKPPTLVEAPPDLGIELESTRSVLEPSRSSLGTDSATPPASSPPTEAGAPSAAPAFTPGQIISSRYRILRFVARGGMGEVYEATDLELEERVALKTIGAKLTHDRQTLERFRREIQIARMVTHPNVCRIFDLGHHKPVGDGLQDTIFLSMEFLEGVTLTEYLKKHGKIEPEQALRIVLDLANGLQAAHEAGVVHRDFKTDNIMLVGSGDELRCVITDFGVAQHQRRSSDDASATRVGEVVGTPAYMSPEQVQGQTITAQSDLFSLGVVMYQVLSGCLPWSGTTPLDTATKRLLAPAPPLQLLEPQIEDHWVEATNRCLELDPKKRFESASQIVSFLHHDRVAAKERRRFEAEKLHAIEVAKAETASEASARFESKERTAKAYRLRLALVCLLVLSSALFAFQRIRASLRDNTFLGTMPQTVVEARRALAVVGLHNVTQREEAAWIGSAVGQMIETELGATGQMRIVPSENVGRMRAELNVEEATSYGRDTLRQMGRSLGTDLVLVGSFTAAESSLRLDLKVQDTASGATVAVASATGNESELFELVASCGESLRQELELERQPGLATPIPLDAEASRLYAQGLEALHEFRPHEARPLIERALERAPDSALLHSVHSTTLASLGYRQEASRAIQRAFELSDQLSAEDRLVVEGRYRSSQQQYERAAEIYENLWRTYPDNLEYGLELASVLTLDRRAEQALEVASRLHALSAADVADPRIHLAEATAAATLSDFRRQENAARRAVAGARQLATNLLLAEALVAQAEAQRTLGRADDAIDACREAVGLFAATGDQGGEATAIACLANTAFARGDSGEARQLFEQAKTLYEGIQDQGGVLRSTNNLAVILRSEGRLIEAKARYRQILDLAAEVDDGLAESSALNNLGAVEFAEGRLQAARASFERALELNRTLNHRGGVASASANVAVALRELGSLDEAATLNADALEMRKEMGDLLGVVGANNLSGRIELYRGSPRSAAESFENARRLAEQIGSERQLGEAEQGLAHAAYLRNDFLEAKQHLAKAAERHEKANDRTNLARIEIALTKIELARRAPASARRHLSRLQSVIVDASDAPRATWHDLLMTRILLLEGDSRGALESFQRATARLAEVENVWLHLEADLLSPHFLEGASLERVTTRAREYGFLELELRGAIAAAHGLSQSSPERANELLRGLGVRATQGGLDLVAQLALENPSAL